MRYHVKKDCGWQTFTAKKGQTLTAADLKTADGGALPDNVLAVFVRTGCLVPVEE